MTKKWQRKNKNGRQLGTYMKYKASHDTIILPKKILVGQCQLTLQPNEEAYHQELLAMRQERLAKSLKENNSPKGEQLPQDLVLDNLRLRDNQIIKANLEVGMELIQVLQQKGRTIKGRALQDQVTGQGGARSTDWILARI